MINNIIKSIWINPQLDNHFMCMLKKIKIKNDCGMDILKKVQIKSLQNIYMSFGLGVLSKFFMAMFITFL